MVTWPFLRCYFYSIAPAEFNLILGYILQGHKCTVPGGIVKCHIHSRNHSRPGISDKEYHRSAYKGVAIVGFYQIIISNGGINLYCHPRSYDKVFRMAGNSAVLQIEFTFSLAGFLLGYNIPVLLVPVIKLHIGWFFILMTGSYASILLFYMLVAVSEHIVVHFSQTGLGSAKVEFLNNLVKVFIVFLC